MQTFNLAYGGATIDGALVPPYLPTVLYVLCSTLPFVRILTTVYQVSC